MVVIPPQQVINMKLYTNLSLLDQKIFTAKKLHELVLSEGNNLKPLIFTNGCFDILHRGHVTYLEQAKSLGKKLVVALNSDDSVRRLGKGNDRPLNCLADRMAVVASLAAVDYVTFFEEDTPLELINLLHPDILVKGGDWGIADIVGAKETLARGGSVHSIAFKFETSTTKLINKIKNHDE